MGSLLRKGSDSLKNGMVLGALSGVFIWQGSKIYSYLIINIPSAWLKLGACSLPIYLIGLGALVGYIVDRT